MEYVHAILMQAFSLLSLLELAEYLCPVAPSQQPKLAPGALLFHLPALQTSCCSGFLSIPGEIFQNSSSGFPSNTNCFQGWQSKPSYDYRLANWKTDSTRWSLTFKCGTVGLHANSKERKSLNSIEVLAKQLVEVFKSLRMDVLENDVDPCLNDKEELNCCCHLLRKRKRTLMGHI